MGDDTGLHLLSPTSIGDHMNDDLSLDELTHKIFPKYEPTGDKALDDAVWAKLKSQVKEMVAESMDGALSRQMEARDD